jgi:hypothetical protein
MTATAEATYEAFVTGRALDVLERARDWGVWAGQPPVAAAMAALEGALKRTGDAASIDAGMAMVKLTAVITDIHGEELAHWVRDGWAGE